MWGMRLCGFLSISKWLNLLSIFRVVEIFLLVFDDNIWDSLSPAFYQSYLKDTQYNALKH